jgi:hypothetical protein
MSAAPQPSLLWSFNGSNVDSIINKAPTNTAGTPTYVSGIYQQAVRLTNPTPVPGTPATTFLHYYSIPIPLTPATTGQTMACWVKFASLATSSGYEQYFLVWGQSFFYLNTAGRWTTNINNGPASYPSVNYAQVPIVGQWYHAASVYDPAVNFLRLYLNGIQVSVSSSAINPVAASTASPNVTLGTAANNDYRCSDVSLSDVRVYNTALTTTQIQGIYNSKGIPPSGTLQQVSAPQPSLLWSFNGSNVDSINQLSPTLSTVDSSITYLPTYVSGLYGQAINFNNYKYNSSVFSASTQQGNSYIYYSLTNINLNNFSASLWINPQGAPPATQSGGQFFFRFIDYAGGLTFTINSSGQLYFSRSATLAFTYTGPSIPTGSWSHIALSLTNIGASAGNTIISIYYNGIFQSSGLTTTSSSTPDLFIGTDNGYKNPYNGYVQDLRIYKTALTATQIQDIYNSKGIPPSGTLQQISNFQYPLSKTSIVSSALGIYSTRSILSTYGGPVVQVRRSSDNTIYDFIADPIGNLSNVQNSTTIASFLSGTTGYIATWYDQSGASNNYSQPTTSNQPQIALNSGKWVMYMPNQSSNLTTQTMSGVMTILVNFNLSSTGYQSILGNVYATDTSLGLRFNTTNVLGDALNNYRPGSDFLGSTGSYWYLNNSYGKLVNAGGPPTISGNGGYYSPTNWNQVIGTQGTNLFGPNAFNTINPGRAGGRGAGPGYISELMLFSDSISPTDAQIIWNNSPLVNSNPTSFT